MVTWLYACPVWAVCSKVQCAQEVLMVNGCFKVQECPQFLVGKLCEFFRRRGWWVTWLGIHCLPPSTGMPQCRCTVCTTLLCSDGRAAAAETCVDRAETRCGCAQLLHQSAVSCLIQSVGEFKGRKPELWRRLSWSWGETSGTSWVSVRQASFGRRASWRGPRCRPPSA